MDLRTLARAYDRSAASYDERFRALQRPKYQAAARLLEEAGFLARKPDDRALILDAGAGTGLFIEWLREPAMPGDPSAALRARILASVDRGRFVALDASAAMLQRARARTPSAVCADLAAPPLRPGSCALVLSFTALLENVPASLRALGLLVQPDGFLCASFLARESPAPEQVARWSGLRSHTLPLAAGQDLVHLVGHEPPAVRER